VTPRYSGLRYTYNAETRKNQSVFEKNVIGEYFRETRASWIRLRKLTSGVIFPELVEK